MRRSIVCAIDHSRTGDAVATMGRQLADRLDDRLLLTHVLEPPASFPYGHELFQRRKRDQAGQAAKRLLRSLGASVGGEQLVLHGETADELLAVARDEHAELIVVGSRGFGAARAALMGSVSHELMTRNQGPLLVIPPGACERLEDPEWMTGRTLVGGVDFSDESAAAVDTAARFARRLGLRLVLVHGFSPLSSSASRAYPGAVPPPDLSLSESRLLSAAARELERFAERALRTDARRCRLRVVPGLPASALLRAAEEEKAALVAVGRRDMGTIKSLLVESTSRKVAARASMPVMVLPGAVDGSASTESGSSDRFATRTGGPTVSTSSGR